MRRGRRGKIEVEFLIPLTEDKGLGDGSKHGPFRWKALQDALEAHFGGWTNAGIQRGAWIDPDTQQRTRDSSRAFKVDVPGDQLAELRQLVRSACRTFVQKCIRVVILGRVEYIKARGNDKPL